MEFKDPQSKVYKIFRDEWVNSPESRMLCDDTSWFNLIKNKNLGIEYISARCFDCYKIVDQKKWLLTRLKYGI